MSAAASVRARAGLFRLARRGMVEVVGSDRERWLEGQLSNEVARARPDRDGGCYAFVLSPIGRIVADVHVIGRPESFWLETAAEAVAPLIERLEKYRIADDVELHDRTAMTGRLALEGPRAADVLGAAIGSSVGPARDGSVEVPCAGIPLVVAAYGWSGERAFQLLMPADALPAVEGELRIAGEALGLVAADEETLELLRVESGTPRFGAELDPEVLPAETGQLERAVSFTKGCFTGQEVVARMQSRGRVKHRLVGVRLDAEQPPAPGAAVEVGGHRVGEITSAVRSPRVGTIALAYVRIPHHEGGTEVRVAGAPGRTATLPFVPPAA